MWPCQSGISRSLDTACLRGQSIRSALLCKYEMKKIKDSQMTRNCPAYQAAFSKTAAFSWQDHHMIFSLSIKEDFRQDKSCMFGCKSMGLKKRESNGFNGNFQKLDSWSWSPNIIAFFDIHVHGNKKKLTLSYNIIICLIISKKFIRTVSEKVDIFI